MSWISRKIEKEKYTRPPTGREVLWAMRAAVDGYRQTAYGDRICGNDSFSKIRYDLPDSIDASDGSDGGLKDLLSALSPFRIDEYMVSDSDSFRELMLNLPAISPERTLERGGGDCKSLAVISVCYKRRAGVPVRFLDVKRGNHLIFEERDGKLWVPKDPQGIMKGVPLPHWHHPYESDPDYDRAYLSTISLV